MDALENRIVHTIILPTRNRAEILAQSLGKLSRIRPDSIESEVLVIDNGSTDGTASVVEELAAKSALPIRYTYEPVPGLLSGRHRGVQQARGELLSFIDDDVVVADGWLAAILEAFGDEVRETRRRTVNSRLPGGSTGLADQDVGGRLRKGSHVTG